VVNEANRYSPIYTHPLGWGSPVNPIRTSVSQNPSKSAFLPIVIAIPRPVSLIIRQLFVSNSRTRGKGMKWVRVGLEYALLISSLWVLGLMFIPSWLRSLRIRLSFRRSY